MANKIRNDLDFQGAKRVLNLPNAITNQEPATLVQLNNAVAGVSGGGAHTHPESEVVGLGAALAGKANASHSHALGDVGGLSSALSSKADTNDARLSDARTPVAHGHSVTDVAGLQTSLDDKALSGHNHDAAYEAKNSNIQSHIQSTHAPVDAQKNSDITSAEIEAKLTGEIATHSHPGSASFVSFTRDLGAQRSGVFDLTGLSGLTPDAPVMVMQSAAPIASKGNARDEPEMDHIHATGYVLDASTVRVYWQAPSVVVGIYAFTYLIGG